MLLVMLFLLSKFLFGLALVGSLVTSQSNNDTTVANYTLAMTWSDPPRGLRADRSLATCGNGNRGDGRCANGQCCSQYGWCGTSTAHCSGSGGGTCGNGSRGNGICSNGQCCSQYGWCGTSSSHCGTGPAPAPTPGQSGTGGTCGNGSRGNGVCSNGQCCSQYGWCGTSTAHCGVGSPGAVGTSLYSGSGSGTYYYDITGRTCNGQAPYQENNGYPTCTSYNPAFWKTLQQYGTNNIVAIDNTLLSAPGGREKYCGKEIKVYKNGVQIAGGPYYVFDGCAACVGGGRIDFSVTAIHQIDSQACTLGVVPGVSWTVTDRQIVPFIA